MVAVRTVTSNFSRRQRRIWQENLAGKMVGRRVGRQQSDDTRMAQSAIAVSIFISHTHAHTHRDTERERESSRRRRHSSRSGSLSISRDQCHITTPSRNTANTAVPKTNKPSLTHAHVRPDVHTCAHLYTST